MENKTSESSNPEWVFNGKNRIRFDFDNNMEVDAYYTIMWNGQETYIKINLPEKTTVDNFPYIHIKSERVDYKINIKRKILSGIKPCPRRPLAVSETHFLEFFWQFNFCEIMVKEKSVRPELMEEVKLLLYGTISEKDAMDDTAICKNPFKIIAASDNKFIDIPLRRKFNIILNKNRVTIYKYDDSKFIFEGQAYFMKNNFVLSYIRYGNGCMKDKYIIVKQKNLHWLYSEFKIKNCNRAELLICILNMFGGPECFDNFLRFLEEKKINYNIY